MLDFTAFLSSTWTLERVHILHGFFFRLSSHYAWTVCFFHVFITSLVSGRFVFYSLSSMLKHEHIVTTCSVWFESGVNERARESGKQAIHTTNNGKKATHKMLMMAMTKTTAKQHGRFNCTYMYFIYFISSHSLTVHVQRHSCDDASRHTLTQIHWHTCKFNESAWNNIVVGITSMYTM